MPVSVKMGGSSPSGGGGGKAQGSASASTADKRTTILGIVCILAILLASYKAYTFFNERQDQVPKMTKVAPLAGFPDEPPFNTKEWQEKFKKGEAIIPSGIPRGAAATGQGPR